MKTRLQAALHETRCWECRVTWKSWLQRIAGVKAGFAPKPTRRQLRKRAA